MADNVILDPGTGGATVAADDVGGVHYQRVKLTDGTADSSTFVHAGGGTEANALRVTVASDSTGVLSVDDNGGSLTVDGTVAVSGTVAVTDNAGSLTVDNSTLSVVGGGTEATAMRVTVASDSTGVLSIDDNGGSLTVDGTVTANLGTAAVTNAGTFAVQDSEKLADDAAFTVGTTKVTPVGYLADQASTDSVNEGDIGAARITLDRKQVMTLAPSADTEGLTIFRTLDADETEEDVKTSAGKLYGWYLYNDGAAEVYVKFYNATAANTTVGSTTPILTLPVPAGGAANVEFANGITFGTALCIAATTGVADADTTAPAANQVIANVFYQ